MALTFAAGTLTLTNWGFGVGDIAVLAGAGRNVGNWVMAQTRDRNLVDFLKVDIDTVITRKGLIDVVELHKRWDRKLVLFRNGRPIAVEHPAGSQLPVVDNMDKFTWFMTLVLATLDAAIGPSSVHAFVSDLLSRLFENSPDGMEYLIREAPQHVQGWRSSACVRGVIAKTELLWKQLAQRGEHWPGWVPSADFDEIMRLLLWLITERSRHFTTASTDAFCFAIILSEIGIEQIAAVKTMTSNSHPDTDTYTDESVISVALYTRWSSTTSSRAKIVENTLAKRHGMTIPLNHMEECMSLWPTERDFAARLRTLFVDGMEAVREDGLVMSAPDIQDWNFEYLVSKNRPLQRPSNRRLDTLEYRVIDAFFPGVSDRASEQVQKLLRSWDSHKREDLETYLKKESDVPQLHLQSSAQAELQALLLGFYYALLRPLVDCTRLSVQEVYGAWGYASGRFLIAIRRLKHHATTRSLNGRSQHQQGEETCQFFQREAVLYLVAFLFAGLEPNSNAVTYSTTSNLAITSARSTIGILSKIAVIPMVMLGSQLERKHAAQLCLLDCDTSFIPCNTSGCVQEGLRSFLLMTEVDADTESNFKGEELFRRLRSDNTTDFTPHIEPDWDNDVQCSMLVYRHQGRIVYSLPFSSILAVLTRDESSHQSPIAFNHPQRVLEPEKIRSLEEQSENWATWADIELPGCIPPNTSMVLASPQDFHGSTILWNRACDGSAIVVASLIGMPNAVLCVLAMYFQRSQYFGLEEVVAVVSHPDEFAKALEAGKQYFIIF